MAALQREIPSSAPAFETVDLPAIDKVPLVARYFPPVGRVRGAVLLAGAMGVPQPYYARFAAWLARAGYHVMTFDPRGMGLSRPAGRSLRGLAVDIIGWARLDATAAFRALQDRVVDPALPITWIGHSVGAQYIPWVPDHADIARIITIAVGSGYWRENSPELRRKAWLLWWVASPIATPLFGYFPGRALRMVGDLPAGVMRQWRRWCLSPDYAVGVEPDAAVRFACVRGPILSLSFTDDEMMSARNTAAIHAQFTGAKVELRRLSPADLGARRIGHFGFFKADEDVWERALGADLSSG